MFPFFSLAAGRKVLSIQASGMLCVLSVLSIWLVGCGALVTTPPPPVKATGSTAITKPYPTPDATQTIYSSPLTQATAGWATGPTCTFTANGLMVRPSGGQAYICLAPASPIGDGAVSVTLKQVNGPPNHAFGIAFHHAAPKNYYFFGIDTLGRFTLTVVVNDVSHNVLPFTHNAAIHSGLGATNQLQVIMKGQNVTLLVNGVAVGQATLSSFASGTVGLRGINNGDVLFQQLTIQPVSAPAH